MDEIVAFARLHPTIQTESTEFQDFINFKSVSNATLPALASALPELEPLPALAPLPATEHKPSEFLENDNLTVLLKRGEKFSDSILYAPAKSWQDVIKEAETFDRILIPAASKKGVDVVIVPKSPARNK